MTLEFATWAASIKQLYREFHRLAKEAESMGVASLEEREWHQLLKVKLLSQTEGEPYLIVAVVGGTNIGKSVIFNHLVGEVASAVSPLASQTRQPVCLVPPQFADESLLSRLFDGFELHRWQSAEDALHDSPEHRLYWRAGTNIPPRLLLLDTPDIDSDARVNWERADQIRRAADVLVAVLTQQKYNDAAVKQFFRKAAEADKPVIAVFNQCDVQEDRAYWPKWLATFVRETGADVRWVYGAPHDRAAARGLSLPFYHVGRDGQLPPEKGGALRDELAALRFDAIKLRTLRGALDVVLDPQRGAPAYLDEVRRVAGEFCRAAQLLSATKLAQVQWPALPMRKLGEEIHGWWDGKRTALARRVHGAYRWLGEKALAPFRAARNYLRPQQDPLESFRRAERDAIVTAVEQLYRELERLAEMGNDALRPRVQKLLSGQARASLLEQVEASHAELPAVGDAFRQYLCRELDKWIQENARAAGTLWLLDQATAFARPALTVTLAVSGWFIAGGLVGDLAAQAVGHTLAHVATDVAIVGSGEAVVGAAGGGVRYAAAQLLRRLEAEFARGRAEWLAKWLEQHFLGGLLSELTAGSQITERSPFQQAHRLVDELSSYGTVAAGTRN